MIRNADLYLGVSGQITSHTGILHHCGGRYYYRRWLMLPDEPFHDLARDLPVLIENLEQLPLRVPRLTFLRRAEHVVEETGAPLPAAMIHDLHVDRQ